MNVGCMNVTVELICKCKCDMNMNTNKNEMETSAHFNSANVRKWNHLSQYAKTTTIHISYYLATMTTRLKPE